MGKVKKRVSNAFSNPLRGAAAVFTFGSSEAVIAGGKALGKETGLIQDPAKPGKLPTDTTEQDLAAARAAELDERKKKRISLITSPGGAFLSAKDLSKPRLLGQ